MNEIVPQFNDSLVIDSSDILGVIYKLGIDSILENDSLKEIPIIKTLYAWERLQRVLWKDT